MYDPKNNLRILQGQGSVNGLTFGRQRATTAKELQPNGISLALDDNRLHSSVRAKGRERLEISSTQLSRFKESAFKKGILVNFKNDLSFMDYITV